MENQLSFVQSEYALKKKQTPKGEVFECDGESSPVAAIVRFASLSERSAWSSADWGGADAADLLPVTMVWAGGRSPRRRHLRQPVDAPLCRDRPGAKVEHPFAGSLRAACWQAISLRSVHVVKNLFHDRKTRYRGLVKNTVQLEILFALANLFLARNSLQPA